MNEQKKKSLIALKKAKTSLEKIISMVENDKDCNDIILQNLSVIWLIKSSNIHLLQAFIENCTFEDIEKKQQKILNILKFLQK